MVDKNVESWRWECGSDGVENPEYVESWKWESASDGRSLRAGKFKSSTKTSSSVPLPPSELQPSQLLELSYWCSDRAAAGGGAAAVTAATAGGDDRAAAATPAAAGVQYDREQGRSLNDPGSELASRAVTANIPGLLGGNSFNVMTLVRAITRQWLYPYKTHIHTLRENSKNKYFES
jgi:hypothetical protein